MGHWYDKDGKPGLEAWKINQTLLAALTLPRKEVWALKIADIKRHNEDDKNAETDGSAMITPADEGYAPFRVDYAYMSKHKPEVGGYYIVYKDGYTSFSPAEAFEDGYSPA